MKQATVYAAAGQICADSKAWSRSSRRLGVLKWHDNACSNPLNGIAGFPALKKLEEDG